MADAAGAKASGDDGGDDERGDDGGRGDRVASDIKNGVSAAAGAICEVDMVGMSVAPSICASRSCFPINLALS